MDKNKFNISQIENFLYKLLKANGVSAHIFAGGLPTAISSSWYDVVDIDCSNTINDLDAYGSGSVLVFLYAKPLENGKKNVPLLDTMEKALNKAILSNDDEIFSIYKKWSKSDYDSNRLLHCNIINIGITIV